MNINGMGAPTKSTFGTIGDYYIDTTTDTMYKLVDINNIDLNYQFIEVDSVDPEKIEYIWEVCESRKTVTELPPDAEPYYVEYETLLDVAADDERWYPIDSQSPSKGFNYSHGGSKFVTLISDEVYSVFVDGVEYEIKCVNEFGSDYPILQGNHKGDSFIIYENSIQAFDKPVSLSIRKKIYHPVLKYSHAFLYGFRNPDPDGPSYYYIDKDTTILATCKYIMELLKGGVTIIERLVTDEGPVDYPFCPSLYVSRDDGIMIESFGGGTKDAIPYPYA